MSLFCLVTSNWKTGAPIEYAGQIKMNFKMIWTPDEPYHYFDRHKINKYNATKRAVLKYFKSSQYCKKSIASELWHSITQHTHSPGGSAVWLLIESFFCITFHSKYIYIEKLHFLIIFVNMFPFQIPGTRMRIKRNKNR